MAIQMEETACAYCGCTEDRACKLPNGDLCGWFRSGRLAGGPVCNAPGCIKAFREDDVRVRRMNYLAALRAGRKRKKGRAA